MSLTHLRPIARRLVIEFRLGRSRLRWWITRSGSPPPYKKHEIVREYARRFRLRTLVETGTYLGDMIAAVRDSFDRVVSIELSPGLHRRAEERFKHDSGVRIVLGDSSSALGPILDELREPCLFWLDAHYSGGITARGTSDTPVHRELDLLLERDLADVILIDDARLFLGTDGYPSVEAVQSLLATRRRGWLCLVANDVIRIHPPVEARQ